MLWRSRTQILLLALFSTSSTATTLSNITTYEYVIIGSGPGGGPLAANLARAGHSVLLLEAGADGGDNLLQRIPFFANSASEDPTMSWEFFVKHYEDDEQAKRDTKFTWRTTNGSFYVGLDPPAGAEPLGIFYPRTGTLGGCGNHNALNLALPLDSDWAHIAELTGDQSWSPSNMRQYFKKLENCQYLPSNTAASAGHGFNGWLYSNLNDVASIEPQIGFQDVLRSAIAATGDGTNATTEEIFSVIHRDMNRNDPKRYQGNGVYQLPLHVNATRERSSAQTYLRATINTLNADGSKKYPLTISTNSLATRVLFDEKTGTGKPKAIGVEYLLGESLYKADPRYNGTQTGILKHVFASKEVIVAGGTFNTPQILKLSGIGPRAELEALNIPVIVDLPAVGTNMQDNYETEVVVEASRDFENVLANCTFLQPGDPCLAEWEDGGKGPYGQGPPIGMLYRSSVSLDNDTDLFYFGAPGAALTGFYPGYSSAQSPLSSFFFSVVKMHPQNRAGTVKLLSANPQDVPEINFNYFSEGASHDLQALKEGVEFAKQIFSSTQGAYAPFTNIDPPPGDDIEQSIRDNAYSHHASSSCSIGPVGGNETCVDSRFRVQGVESLRVVDASVFPRVPGGFPILPTFMVSEKATDVILEDAGDC